jgi:hypothetical protein
MSKNKTIPIIFNATLFLVVFTSFQLTVAAQSEKVQGLKDGTATLSFSSLLPNPDKSMSCSLLTEDTQISQKQGLLQVRRTVRAGESSLPIRPAWRRYAGSGRVQHRNRSSAE